MPNTRIIAEGEKPSLINKFTLRAARREDYPFALELYLESTLPLLTALGRWDEEKVLSRFAEGFKLDEIRVLSVNGSAAGWIQVSETPEEFHVDQIHLVESARNRGIGSGLIRDLQERASACGKAVALNVIQGNRAHRLYERLGFLVAGGEDEKIRMVWRKDQEDPVESADG
jgi:ribosomal protein S18 acetylase RimI-like enzyme